MMCLILSCHLGLSGLVFNIEPRPFVQGISQQKGGVGWKSAFLRPESRLLHHDIQDALIYISYETVLYAAAPDSVQMSRPGSVGFRPGQFRNTPGRDSDRQQPSFWEFLPISNERSLNMQIVLEALVSCWRG
jgi:hypothetical protein